MKQHRAAWLTARLVLTVSFDQLKPPWSIVVHTGQLTQMFLISK